MKTYKCEYIASVNGEFVSAKIEAENHRQAYDKFLENHGTYNASVMVKAGFSDPGAYFADHVQKSLEQVNREQSMVAEEQAAKEAQSSLSSTDVLLKQLIAKQDETNLWLKAIRWTLAGILIMLAVWNIRVFG